MGTFEEHLLAKDKMKVGSIVKRYKTGDMEYLVSEITHRRDFFKLVPVSSSNDSGLWIPYEEISEVVKSNHSRIK